MDKSGGHDSTAESYGWFRRSFGRLRIDRRANVAQRHTALNDKPLLESEGFKGPLGLQLLRTVSEPLVDFIFIHGLGGGSRKTWSKSPDPYHYWPKEWLSQDPEFDKVRIYSFGYKADWAEKTASILNIHDFALSLLGEIKCNPDIRRSNTKLVLVAHSMGGLVAKKVDHSMSSFVHFWAHHPTCIYPRSGRPYSEGDWSANPYIILSRHASPGLRSCNDSRKCP
ncbi:uncharacterized protein AKAW2_10214A [Aspergillus luchuensis]|uniref:GPI inositol-deacylase n=1 Tax=Aspergillus kawachii TaxID=1069201 RepID=A0A7R7ZSR0_ASPKA|nr:uncharacterized protein AKAW2_10214A [Aspergillus luchuensis]BCR93168.1 hypothetical protein AKAW2_10214A [Aspergillus luchuensis]